VKAQIARNITDVDDGFPTAQCAPGTDKSASWAHDLLPSAA